MRCLHSRSALTLPGLLTALLLAGCQSAPPRPAQPFFTAGLSPELLQPHGGFRLDQPVRHPAVTRHASLASRAPQYGLMTEPNARQPAFAVQKLDDLFAVTPTVNAAFLRQLKARAPALAARHSATAQAAWQFDVRRVAIFSKDMRETRCEAMWFMRANLVDARGKLLWSSGYANSRLSDDIGHDCARIGRDRAYAAQVVQAAMNAAVADIISKAASAP